MHSTDTDMTVSGRETAGVAHGGSSQGRPVRRVAILYSRLAAYMVACLRALRETYDVELLIYQYPPADEAPYDRALFDELGTVLDRTQHSDEEILARVRAFDPDAMYIVGWMDRGYLNVARALRNDGVPVIAGCDRQWAGTWRQRLGQLAAPWYLHPAIDVLWVPGERQRQLARRLGYRGARCWSGIYCCDWDRFADARRPVSERTQTFLYVGRYVDVKGIDVLLEAYQAYRGAVERPWTLTCVGTGPQADRLQGLPGVEDRGFVQPDALPAIMARAGAFVLPSRHEPWGVVVQEAAAAGLPLICSEACGAAVHLLQDRYNGFLVETDQANHLATAMAQMAALDPERRQAMGARSHALSKPFTPARWAATLIEGVQQMHSG